MHHTDAEGPTSSPTRPPAWRRSPLGLHPLLLTAIVAAIAVGTVPVAPAPVRTWVTWLLFTVLHVWFCRHAWTVFRDPAASLTTRRLWRAFFVAVALFLIGDLAQLVVLATEPWSLDVAVGSPVQGALLLAGMAVVVVAAITLPMQLSSNRAAARFWLDVGNVSIGVIALAVALQPRSGTDDGVALLSELVMGPLLFTLATVAIAKLLVVRDRPFTTTAGRVLAVAALGEALLGTITLRPDLAENLVLINGVALTSNALLALAARAQARTPGPDPTVPRPRPRLTALPYAAVLITNVLLVAIVADEGMRARGWLLLGAAVASTALVLGRQVLVLAEQASLLDTLHATLDERNELTDRLAHLAYHDPLTGLANRARFEAALDVAVEECLAAADDPDHKHLGIVLVDLDGFKNVNDTHGHAVGDEALSAIANRIQACVRAEDLVARFGGDEFYVLLPAGIDDAEPVARRIVTTLSEPIAVSGHLVQLGASAGVAFAGRAGWNSGELLRRADVAMYTAKSLGKGQVVVDQQ